MNRRQMMVLSLLLLVCTVLFSGILIAEEEEKDTIILRSNFMRYNREEGFYLAKEDVEIHHQDYLLTGDEAEIHEDDVLYMRGNVVVYRGDDILKGESLTFYYEEDHLIMDSPFDLVQHREREREDGTIEDETLHMVGEYLEMFGAEDRLYARDSVHVVRGDTLIWSDELEYFEELDELHLLGNVIVEEDGETIKAREVKMWLTEDVFEAFGEVEAEVRIRRSREEVEELEEVEDVDEN